MKRGNTTELQKSGKKRRVGESAPVSQEDLFAQMPDEILDLVFQHSPPVDHADWLTMFGAVCNRWRRMSKAFVQELEIAKPSAFIISDVVSSLPNVVSLIIKEPLPTELPTLTTIKKLSVLDLEFPENPDDSKMKHTFALIGQLSTRLEDLTLSGTISNEQIAALSSLVNLKSLSFSNVRSITLASVPVLRHLTALKTLEMPYQWDAGPDLAGLTQLKVLNATGDGLNTLEDLEGLVNLELVDLGEIPAGHVGHIGAWTNLHALTIYRMPSHASISRWTALQRLEYLDLSDGTITPTVLKGVFECPNLRSIHIEDGAWLDWDLVQEDMFANVSRLTNLVSLCDLKHHPVFDTPISRLPDSLTCLEIISDNGQMREQFFANIRHLTNLKSLTFSYAQGGKNALNSAIIEGLAVLTALETLHIGNNRYNDEFYPIFREMVRMTGPAAAAFLEQYASHTSSFPQVSLAAFSSLTSLCELSVDLDPFFEDQVRALTTLTNLKKVKFGKHFATADFFTLIGQPVPQDNDDHEYIMEAE